jgi:hypothetical protein
MNYQADSEVKLCRNATLHRCVVSVRYVVFQPSNPRTVYRGGFDGGSLGFGYCRRTRACAFPGFGLPDQLYMASYISAGLPCRPYP